MAWSLSRAFPDVRLQMVAEEDSADLRRATATSILGGEVVGEDRVRGARKCMFECRWHCR